MKTITDYFSKKYNRKFPLLVADLLSTLPLYYLFNYVQMGLHTQQYGMYAKILSLTILSELCMKVLKKYPYPLHGDPFYIVLRNPVIPIYCPLMDRRLPKPSDFHPDMS